MIACFVSWDGYTHSHKNYPVTDSYGRLSPDPDNDYGINIVYRVRSDGVVDYRNFVDNSYGVTTLRAMIMLEHLS